MTPARKRNLLRAPFVVFVRMPILLPFLLLVRVGKIAEEIGEVIARKLPGFEYEPLDAPRAALAGEKKDE